MSENQSTDSLKIPSALSRLNEILCGYADGLIVKIMSVVKRSITYRIIQASSNARLSLCDEKFFDYYIDLMSNYRDLISFYHENIRNILEAGDIREIMDGMVSILSSQVNNSAELDGKSQENPVSIEKKLIVTNAINQFVEKFDNIQQVFFNERSEGCRNLCRETAAGGFEFAGTIRLISYILEELQSSYAGEFYSEYQSGFTNCCAELNDIHSRSAANFYYEQVVKEREILSPLITVQISALEQKSADMTETDRSLVAAFVSKLQEIHQRFGGQVSEITEYMTGDPKAMPSPEPEPFEDFMEYIKSQTEPSQIFPAKMFDDTKNSFQNALDFLVECIGDEVTKKINADIKTFETTKIIYGLQKEISAELIMAEEIASTFNGVVRYYRENEPELTSCRQTDIMKAIVETVEIKNESIHENRDIFAEEIKKSVDQMRNDVVYINPEDLRQYCYSIFMESVADGCLVSPFNLEAAMDSAIIAEKTTPLRQAYLKRQSAFANSIEKKILQFKKEHILYEISTFEEILNFSITRIRESDSEKTLDFVKKVDDVVTDIQIILKKNGIDLIRPSAHDMFNGKEHEVLIAEKNEEFQKGEIIKLMNSGYKQGNVVILRANVVAAK